MPHPPRHLQTGGSHGPQLCIIPAGAGYVSPDFREHPVGSIMQYLIAGHDTAVVEVRPVGRRPTHRSSLTHVALQCN
jgi:hypothetical protein